MFTVGAGSHFTAIAVAIPRPLGRGAATAIRVANCHRRGNSLSARRGPNPPSRLLSRPFPLHYPTICYLIGNISNNIEGGGPHQPITPPWGGWGPRGAGGRMWATGMGTEIARCKGHATMGHGYCNYGELWRIAPLPGATAVACPLQAGNYHAR